MEIDEKLLQKPKLIYYPNQILRTNCQEVPATFFNETQLTKVCLAMQSIARQYDGVGLAAPQIGVNARIVLITSSPKKYFFLINPVIVEASTRKILDSEGCLSLPNIFGTVVRSEKIVVQALDQLGNKIEIEVKDVISRIIQHEIDHLNGVLFIDKVITITDGKEKLEKLMALNEKANKTL